MAIRVGEWNGKKPDIDRGEVHNWDNPNHWLCESSLKDESELEEFLLQNIKVGGEKQKHS